MTQIDTTLLQRLRQFSASGTRIGAVDTGSYVLARADILKNRRCTIHWEKLNAFAEEFSQTTVTDRLVESDKECITSAGGIAVIDMMFDWISGECGQKLVASLADQFQHDRAFDTQQRLAVRNSVFGSSPKLIQCIEYLQKCREGRLSLSELAQSVSLSHRQIQRLFRKHLKASPTQYFNALRLYRARTLLQCTTLRVIDISIMCGYSSHARFTSCYRKLFGRTPRLDRQ